MITEEYRKELEDWVNNHTEYYNEYVRTMKNSKRATLATYMHIYDYAMRRIPGLPTSVELGACSYLFRNYYEKYGFSDLVGMHFLVVGNDKWLGLKSLAQQKKLKMAISSWLVIGDLQTDIISMIRNHPNKTKYEEALYELETRIIRNSIFSGLKDAEYWYSQRVFSKLGLTKEELDKCIMSYLPHKPVNLKPASKVKEVLPQNQIPAKVDTNTNGAPKEDSYEDELKHMNSFSPITEDGPYLDDLYDHLVEFKQIEDIDKKYFCDLIEHAYFKPLYKIGVRINIKYVIRRLTPFYSDKWLEQVCNSIYENKESITKNMPKNKKFVDEFPSLNKGE